MSFFRDTTSHAISFENVGSIWPKRRILIKISNKIAALIEIPVDLKVGKINFFNGKSINLFCNPSINVTPFLRQRINKKEISQNWLFRFQFTEHNPIEIHRCKSTSKSNPSGTFCLFSASLSAWHSMQSHKQQNYYLTIMVRTKQLQFSWMEKVIKTDQWMHEWTAQKVMSSKNSIPFMKTGEGEKNTAVFLKK